MEFILLIAYLVIHKLADTWFGWKQVQVQYGVEMQRMRSERSEDKEEDTKSIGFVNYGNTMREVEEEYEEE